MEHVLMGCVRQTVDANVPKARFPFKRNRLRCVSCVNEKPQETQALALESSQSWLPLLRPSIPIGWRLRLLRENFTRLFHAFSPVPIQTQRTQRKRLRLDGDRALAYYF